MPETREDIQSFEFNIERFLSILSNYSNNYICIIFLCGPHQKGKSTFAKAITGNQAFHMGNGLRGTTKKY